MYGDARLLISTLIAALVGVQKVPNIRHRCRRQ